MGNPIEGQKPILCVDFDGVIHSYTTKPFVADQVPDPPVPGAFDFLRAALVSFRVAVFSSRSSHVGGVDAMYDWMINNGGQDIVTEIEWVTEKPPAMVTLDDRAITFTGQWPTVASLLAFKTWQQ